MGKPVEALERMRREWIKVSGDQYHADRITILAWADSVPEWPKEATREWFEAEAELCADDTDQSRSRILRALAAIAPVKRKRMVNLWFDLENDRTTWADASLDAQMLQCGWSKVNREPVEIED